MIFKMLSKDFKNIIDRLYIVVPKMSAIPALHGVQIIADKENDTLSFRVSDLEAYLTINANMRDVEIIEGGKVIIDIDTAIKRNHGQYPYENAILLKEYPVSVRDEIARRYLEAGWKYVIHRTSSENGERPGLTHFKLSMTPIEW